MITKLYANAFGPDDKMDIPVEVIYQDRRWVVGSRLDRGEISAYHCCKPTKWVLIQVATWVVEGRLACYGCNEEAPDHIYTMMRLLHL